MPRTQPAPKQSSRQSQRLKDQIPKTQTKKSSVPLSSKQQHAGKVAKAKKSSARFYGLQESKKQLELAGQQSMPKALHSASTENSHDYQMQQLLLAQQNRKRLTIAYNELARRHNMPKTEYLQDYQMQLLLLDQQNRKRLMMARNESARRQSTPKAIRCASTERLQDYQMQLLLLEQQNRKRLIMARNERDDFQEKMKAKRKSKL